MFAMHLNDTCGMVTTALTALVALAFVIFQVMQKQWVGVGTFALVLAILAICCQSGVCRCVGDFRICLLLAVLAANVVALPQRAASGAGAGAETFANPDAADGASVAPASDTASSAPSTPPVATKGPESATSSATQATTSDSPTAAATTDDADADDDKEPNYVDTFSTFMETYKSLTPGQIETMTSDTKDLIATQKSLMETVKSLAPVITQGREMMDTFKDYFGPNSHQDLMKAFKGGNKKAAQA